MQHLESWHRIAIRIVGVKAEAKIRVGEVFRLRSGAHIEEPPVVRLLHQADRRNRLQNGAVPRWHLRYKGEPFYSQSPEPARRRFTTAAKLGKAQPFKILARIPPSRITPQRHGPRRARGRSVALLCEPGNRQRSRRHPALPVDQHLPVLDARAANFWRLRQVRDIDQALAAVRLAMNRVIVDQPQAREFTVVSIGPRHG